MTEKRPAEMCVLRTLLIAHRPLAAALLLAVCHRVPLSVANAQADATLEACAPAPRIDPAVLTVSWPKKMGQRVRFSARIERSLDLTEALVVARRGRFVVMLAPDQLWQGVAERTFTVIGSKSVALRGRVTLPELLLEAEGCAP